MPALTEKTLAMTISLLQHQNTSIAALCSLIRDTSSEEKELLERVQKVSTASKKKKEELLIECKQSSNQSVEEATKKKTDELSKIEERRVLEPHLLKEKHEQRIEQIHSSALEIREQTDTKLIDATWLAESVYEGAMRGPRLQAQDATDNLEETRELLDALCEEAPNVLSKMRQTHIQHDLDEAVSVEKSMAVYTDTATKALEAIKSDTKAKWFTGLRPLFIVLFCTGTAVAVGGAYTQWELNMEFFLIPICTAILVTLILAVTFVSGKNSVRKKQILFSQSVALAQAAYTTSITAIDHNRLSKEKAIATTRDIDIAKAENKYKPRLLEIDRLLKKDIQKEEKRFESVRKKLKDKIEQDSIETSATFNNTIAQIKLEETTRIDTINVEYDDAIKIIESDKQETMLRLTSRWKQEFATFDTFCNNQKEINQQEHPTWGHNWLDWKPCTTPHSTIQLGHFTVNIPSIAGDLPTSDVFTLNCEPTITLPLSTTLPEDTSILISASGKHRKTGIKLLQNAMLRTLTSIPPGKVKFTLLDPVGLGQSFASVLHLSDYEESQLLDRAWTEPRHIETQLARLTEHMETVIQKYLRNEFETIDAYNEQAGEIAEPYHFLVLADFPNNISDISARRLTSIITSGARCGVHVIIHHDNSIPLPNGIDPEILQRIPMRIAEEDGTFKIDEEELRVLPLTIETPPDEDVATSIVKKVGETADATHRVEVPFEVIAPPVNEIWSRSTTNKIAIPLGRSGATKLQNLTLGRGTAQHALIAGKTGSGKSTLLHVLITNLALWYSPDEVEFYLVDFKKGVEFKTYATHKLPHAKVIAVESDREFGISVLQRIDTELKRRGELFRDLGVQDIAGFREKSSNRMPRILLIIDEFQEFFVDDDRVSQEANLLLDRLVRQGRAFGIHAIMGSQTLDGAYTLSRTTMGQMAVRVALQCSEQDSYIILNEDNAAARLLSRPGEAIYNDAAGNIEGNSPFQVVWLNENQREVLLSNLQEREHGNKQDLVVYEGNQPIHLQENTAYTSLTKNSKPLAAKVWLGGAMAIKEDTFATFRTASASNLLIVGQQDETTTNMVANALLSLQAQYKQDDASFVLLDGTPADSSFANVLTSIAKNMECPIEKIGVREVEGAMATIHTELLRRIEEGAADIPSIYLVINALHRFRDLRRNEDDFGFSMGDEDKPKTPSQVLGELLKEGPTLGMHVICSTDTLANLNRTFDRQALREFDMRVLLQMGANDSTNLIDMPDASRLGMHRALLYSEETGTIEPFRPYAPDES